MTTAKTKKAAAPAPAPAQPNEEEQIPILPFGEGTPPAGIGTHTGGGTGPGEPIKLEDLPRLVFVDDHGNRYRLDPYQTRGHYLLRQIPGG